MLSVVLFMVEVQCVSSLELNNRKQINTVVQLSCKSKGNKNI